MTKQFGGAEKHGVSIFLNPEIKFKKWIVPKIPAQVETYHLTLLTIVWSILNVIWASFARDDLAWLWLVSLNIILQYITDLLDGELGRYRNTGLVKWGFFMDHFLDYVFLSSLVFAGYLISPQGLEIWYLLLMIILGSFMTTSFLSFAATNKFEIYHFGIGPTEARLVLIIINTFIIFRGSVDFYFLLPVCTFILFICLLVYVYLTQKKLWYLDKSEDC